LYGELRIFDLAVLSDYGGLIAAYQCQHCGNFICFSCEKKNVKHKKFLGGWHKTDSRCPNCDNSLYPSPSKIIFFRKPYKKPPAVSHLKMNEEYLSGKIDIPDERFYYSLIGPGYSFELSKSRFRGQARNIPLEDITAVDIGSGKGMLVFGFYKLLVKTQSEDTDWMQFEAGMNHYDVYMFAKELSKAANATFCKPIMVGETKDHQKLVEFHIKSGLSWQEEGIAWPQKCSSCLSEENLKVEKKEISRGTELSSEVISHFAGNFMGEILDPKVGTSSVAYLIPRCQTCINEKNIGVILTRFNGVRAVAKFRNDQYAEEFVNLNE